MRRRMHRFFRQLKFWIEWSYYLRCKSCCIGCQYFDQCALEVEDILDMSKTF